jgi:GH35 family endo-1,4-beta-xylanase
VLPLFFEQAIKRRGSEKNRVAFLNLVDSPIGKGVPIQGIGFESHIVKWTGGVSHEGVMWLLGELQKRNLEVHISEFDVSVFGGSNGALDHSVADPTVIVRAPLPCGSMLLYRILSCA